MSGSRPVVVLTVDTEEDDWGRYDVRQPATSNITRLPSFQALCDAYGAVPTYLCNWPVTADGSAGDILRELRRSGRCEIGTHIHPWNTPPVEEQTGPRTSMLCNLPSALIRAKLTAVHEQITHRVQAEPTSFRAGRWGFGDDVARVLLDLGYRVDSSVSPYIDWRADFGPDYRRAPAHPYRFDPAEPLRADPAGALVEVPATVGFLGGRPALGLRLRQWALRPLPRRLRMVGVLDRLGLATQRWLSPELSTGPELIRLARRLVRDGAACLNFTFHSPTLVPGLTPFVRTERERAEFVGRIEQFLDHARGAGWRFDGLGRVPGLLGL